MSTEKRGRGRPKFAPGEARTVVLQVRVSETEMAAIQAAAERDGSPSISEWARARLVTDSGV